jgi:uncharacterized protein YecE (DUF72 family)
VSPVQDRSETQRDSSGDRRTQDRDTRPAQAFTTAELNSSFYRWPAPAAFTTDFVYVRMHGPDRDHLYAGSYPDADLRWWAMRIGEWDRARVR